MPANLAKPTGPTAWGSGDSWTQGGSACFVSRRGLIPHRTFCPFFSRQHQSWEAVSGSPVTTEKSGVRRVKGRIAICRPLLQIPGSPHTCIPRQPTACIAKSRPAVKTHAHTQAARQGCSRCDGTVAQHDMIDSQHTWHTHKIRQSDNPMHWPPLVWNQGWCKRRGRFVWPVAEENNICEG